MCAPAGSLPCGLADVLMHPDTHPRIVRSQAAQWPVVELAPRKIVCAIQIFAAPPPKAVAPAPNAGGLFGRGAVGPVPTKSGIEFLPANASVATLVALGSKLAGKGVGAKMKVVCKASFAQPGSYRPTTGKPSATVTSGDTRLLCELLAELREEAPPNLFNPNPKIDAGKAAFDYDPFVGSPEVPASWAYGVDVTVTLLADDDGDDDDGNAAAAAEAEAKEGEARAGKILKKQYWSYVNPNYYYHKRCSPVGREAVQAVLLVSTRSCEKLRLPELPPEIWHSILGFIPAGELGFSQLQLDREMFFGVSPSAFAVAPIRVYVPPLSVLTAIKQSHLTFPVGWHKHCSDFHRLRDALSPNEKKELETQKLAEFRTQRNEEAAARYGEHKVNLNVSSDKFFKVHYLKELIPPEVLARGFKEGTDVYTHDELHELLAYAKGVPVYTTMKRDQTTVMLDRKLFEAAPLETQLNLVREETMAMAAERLVVPALLRGRIPDPQPAYRVALAMTLTTHSKGWFRDFGIEHFRDVKDCNVNYVELLQKDGRIKTSDEIIGELAGNQPQDGAAGDAAAAAEPAVSGHAAFIDTFEKDRPATELSVGAAVVTSESYLQLMLTRSQVAALVNNPEAFGVTPTRSAGIDDGMLSYACAGLDAGLYTVRNQRYNHKFSLGAVTVLGLGCPVPGTSNNVMDLSQQQTRNADVLVPRATQEPPMQHGSESMTQYRERLLRGTSWVARPGAGIDELVTWANALGESADAAAAGTAAGSAAEVVYILIENAQLITSISQVGSGGRYAIGSGDCLLVSEDQTPSSRLGWAGSVMLPMYHRPAIRSVPDAAGARMVASHAALSKLAKEAVFMNTGIAQVTRFQSAALPDDALKVGTKVTLSANFAEFGDAAGGPMAPGDTCTIVEIHNSVVDPSYSVLHKGTSHWYEAGALRAVATPAADEPPPPLPPKTLREALGLTLDADIEAFSKQRIGSKYGPFRWSLPGGVTLELYEKDQCDASHVDEDNVSHSEEWFTKRGEGINTRTTMSYEHSLTWYTATDAGTGPVATLCRVNFNMVKDSWDTRDRSFQYFFGSSDVTDGDGWAAMRGLATAVGVGQCVSMLEFADFIFRLAACEPSVRPGSDEWGYNYAKDEAKGTAEASTDDVRLAFVHHTGYGDSAQDQTPLKLSNDARFTPVGVWTGYWGNKALAQTWSIKPACAAEFKGVLEVGRNYVQGFNPEGKLDDLSAASEEGHWLGAGDVPLQVGEKTVCVAKAKLIVAPALAKQIACSLDGAANCVPSTATATATAPATSEQPADGDVEMTASSAGASGAAGAADSGGVARTIQAFDRAVPVAGTDIIATQGVCNFSTAADEKKKENAGEADVGHYTRISNAAAARRARAKASIDNVALACGVKEVKLLRLEHFAVTEEDAYDKFITQLTKFTEQILQRADVFARGSRSHKEPTKVPAGDAKAPAPESADPAGDAQATLDRTIDLRSVVIAAGTMGGHPSGSVALSLPP